MDTHLPVHGRWPHPEAEQRDRERRRSERLDRLLDRSVAVVLGAKILLFLWIVAVLLGAHSGEIPA